MKNKKILLGVSGGIAAYKACTLANLFQKNGAEVRVVMTNSAMKFITPLTFETLTNNRVYTDCFENKNPEEVLHIGLAKWCDIMLIAPATTNIIGKIASGIADDLLTTIVVALPRNKQVVIAPAMNVEMWDDPIFQRNLTILNDYNKFEFIEPDSGLLACGDVGKGKLANTNTILDYIKGKLK